VISTLGARHLIRRNSEAMNEKLDALVAR
jgi:hypothetical protein